MAGGRKKSWGKHLNNCKGFQWAAASLESGFAKVCISHESFWLCNVIELPDGRLKAEVDNDLFLPENRRRFKLGDTVTFEVTD